jgi:CO/xanthine dehydrogenase Mo-binding subunit
MKKRGIGIAAGLYPMGMSGGGDSSQALVKVQPDGSAVLTVGSCDIGQGCKNRAGPNGRGGPGNRICAGESG